MEVSKRAFLGGAVSSALLASLTGCVTTPIWYRRICGLRVRRSVYSLLAENPNHPVLQAYAAGVAAMKQLPASDPTSWLYQANIHGTNISSGSWPLGAPWGTCPHSSIFFIAWHRLYLLQFERIIAAKAGVPGFALPYWDYSQPGAGALPPPFLSTTSPLYEAVRPIGVNGGGSLTGATASAASALGKPNYLGTGQFQSQLESQPHNAVHSALGGKMGSTTTAAQDPIFWLHHAYIDRLQESWLRNSATHNLSTATSNATWMGVLGDFKFVQPDGSFVTLTAPQTLSTVVAPLGYVYDEDVNPICRAIPINPVSNNLMRTVPPADRDYFSGLAARTQARRRGIDLTAERRVRVPIDAATLRLLSRRTEGLRYYLLLNDVTARISPDVIYAVHIGEGDAPEPVEQERFAGFVSFFGRLDEERQHGGVRDHLPPPIIALDISDLVRAGEFREQIVAAGELPVLFTPVGVEDPRGRGGPPRPAPSSAPMIGEAMVVAVPESELR